MKEPLRLVEDSDDEFVVQMFKAARRQAPSATSMQKTLLAVGSSASLLAGYSTASAGMTWLSLGKLATKWTLLSGVVVMSGAASVELVSRAETPATRADLREQRTMPAGLRGPRMTTPAIPTAPATNEPETSVSASGATTTTAAEVPPTTRTAAGTLNVPAGPERQQTLRRASGARPAPSPERSDGTLADEVLTLDAARQALAMGNLSQALSAADEYLQRFPEGQLEPEARYLKMRAQQALGNQASASAEARRLLELTPTGPHARAAKAQRGVE